MAKAKPSYGRGTGKPHPVDVHVGARVRLRRTLHGMTQTDLGGAIGMTFQQVQKYENGKNRIGAGRLFKLSQVLDVPIEYFFEDIPPMALASSPAKRHGKAKEPAKHELDPFARRETLSFVRSYYEIKDANVRQRMYKLIKVLGSGKGN